MKQNTNIDEQLWTDVEAVFAANRPTRDEAEWEALTREVSDEELKAAGGFGFVPEDSQGKRLSWRLLGKEPFVKTEGKVGRTHRVALWACIVAASAVLLVAFLLLKPEPEFQLPTTEPPTAHVRTQPETRTDVKPNTYGRNAEHVRTYPAIHTDVSYEATVPIVQPSEDLLANENLLGIYGYYTDSRSIEYQRAINLNRYPEPTYLMSDKVLIASMFNNFFAHVSNAFNSFIQDQNAFEVSSNYLPLSFYRPLLAVAEVPFEDSITEMPEVYLTTKVKRSITPEQRVQLLARIEEMQPEIDAYMKEVDEQVEYVQREIHETLDEADQRAREIEDAVLDELRLMDCGVSSKIY